MKELKYLIDTTHTSLFLGKTVQWYYESAINIISE